MSRDQALRAKGGSAGVAGGVFADTNATAAPEACSAQMFNWIAVVQARKLVQLNLRSLQGAANVACAK